MYTAIEIFKGVYPKKYLCQLVSSQLDIDRLDYLTRDSFFSGVVEGKVGYDRLIMMLNVSENKLVIEEKGISSVEKFLLSRRMMYSQVYLHKTSLAAEQMLKMFVKRSVKLMDSGTNVIINENVSSLIKASHQNDSNVYKSIIQFFTQIDDIDIMEMLKKNQKSSDQAIKILSQSMLKRDLFGVSLSAEKPSDDKVSSLSEKLASANNLESSVVNELIAVVNGGFSTYTSGNPICILMKNGDLKDFVSLSHILPVDQQGELFYTIAPKEGFGNNL
jgi:HD superfamily phosphohydrolase